MTAMRWICLALVLAAAPAHAKLREATPPAPAPAPPPSPALPATSEGPVVELKDGTRVVGGLGVESFRLETAYGILQIPAADVVMIRFGTRSDPELGPRIAVLVRELGDADYATREKATQALVRLGSVARKALQGAAASGDAEVKERAEGLLAQIEDLEEEAPPEEDEVVTDRFTARGSLQGERFQVTTRFGVLAVEKRHMARVLLKEGGVSASFRVPGSKGSGNDYFDTRIVVKRGQHLVLRARGSITLTAWGQSCGPEGNPNCGQVMQGIPMGCLMARLGNRGTPFRVGEGYEGVAERDGTLFLAVGCNQNGQQNTGEFKVDVQVKEVP